MGWFGSGSSLSPDIAENRPLPGYLGNVKGAAMLSLNPIAHVSWPKTLF